MRLFTVTHPKTNQALVIKMPETAADTPLTEVEEFLVALQLQVTLLERASHQQLEDLTTACELMTPEQLAEYLHRVYPEIFPR